jgi:UDP-glucuronate decarboxylase
LVIELTGSRSKLTFHPLPADDPKQRRPDISRAEAKLGWRPTMPLRNGLVTTIAYFENLMRSADGPNEIGASRRSLVGRAGA